jgi:hypothetical protein
VKPTADNAKMAATTTAEPSETARMWSIDERVGGGTTTQP